MESSYLSLCRICLQPGATLPIFEKSEEPNNILQNLSLCVSEKVEDVEGYPRHICSSCNNVLETLSKFICKFRESKKKLLENGLNLIKKEVAYTDDSDHSLSEPEIDLQDIKAESDDFEVSLATLVKPKAEIKTKKNKQSNKKPKKPVKKVQAGNKTSKIASSILEGNFTFDGEKWCMRIGQTTLKRIRTNTAFPKPRPQTTIKLPIEKKEPVEKLCDLCGDVYNGQEQLSRHKSSTHFSNPVKCPNCPKVCSSENNLKRHIIRAHSAVRDYICSTCGRAFAFQGELRTHIKNVHEKLKTKKIYKCKICDKTYKCSKSVIIHERSVHTGQRPAVCSICGNSFYHEDYLRDHMRLHTGETPYKCPICGRGYAQRCNMKSHLRIHRVSELDPITLSKLKPNYLKRLKM